MQDWIPPALSHRGHIFWHWGANESDSVSNTHKVSTFVEMDSLPWGTGNSLKASPAVQRKGEQRSFFSASRAGQGREDGSFPHCTRQRLGVTERQNCRSFSSPQDSDPPPLLPFPARVLLPSHLWSCQHPLFPLQASDLWTLDTGEGTIPAPQTHSHLLPQS